MRRPLTQQVGPMPQSPAGPDIIDFRLGQPSPRLLPLHAIRDAALDRLGDDADPLILQYGVSAGHAAFRSDLAEFLSDGYQHAVRPEELAVTAGTSAALSMVSQQFAPPGGVIASGDPTYFLAADIFRAHHLDVAGIPVDDEGIDVDALEHELANGLRPAFVYCIPTFHNPTGVSLARRRAERLVELAEAHDFIVVADEPYPLLHFPCPDGTPPGSLMKLDDGRGRVLSLGSMSKILGPGLRLGWAHAAPSLLGRLLQHGSIRSGGCVNPLVATIVHGTLLNGFLPKHIAMLKKELHGRAQTMIGALRAHGMTATMPQGGYFVWTDAGRDTSALLASSREQFGVGYAPGARCALTRDLRTHLRLSFAFYESDEIAEGVDRLADALC